jgi:hypothetical protein
MKKRLSYFFVLALTFIFNVAGMESGSRIIKDYGSGGRFIISVSEDRTTITGTYIKCTGTGSLSTHVEKQTGEDFKEEDVSGYSRENYGYCSTLTKPMTPELAIVVELKRLILEMEMKLD